MVTVEQALLLATEGNEESLFTALAKNSEDLAKVEEEYSRGTVSYLSHKLIINVSNIVEKVLKQGLKAAQQEEETQMLMKMAENERKKG